jgi:hypothetical protein
MGDMGYASEAQNIENQHAKKRGDQRCGGGDSVSQREGQVQGSVTLSGFDSVTSAGGANGSSEDFYVHSAAGGSAASLGTGQAALKRASSVKHNHPFELR